MGGDAAASARAARAPRARRRHQHGARRGRPDPALADSEPGSDVNRPGTPAPNGGAAAPLRLRHGPDGRPLRRRPARHADGQRLLRRPRRPRLDLRPAAPDRPRGPAGLVRHEVVPQRRQQPAYAGAGQGLCPLDAAAACPPRADGPRGWWRLGGGLGGGLGARSRRCSGRRSRRRLQQTHGPSGRARRDRHRRARISPLSSGRSSRCRTPIRAAISRSSGRIATPEMAGYIQEELNDFAARGVVNNASPT